jgi:hypothetical protein
VFAFFLPSITLLPAGLVLAIGSGIFIRSRRAQEDRRYRELKFK